MAKKLPVSNKSSGNLADYAAGSESYETRNEVIPNPETMRQELLAVLGYYKESSDVDKSPLEIGQTNSQQEVMGKITEAVLQEQYPTAQAILFREDIKMTPQMEEIALRLNRLVQVGVRQGTTDVMEFKEAKKEIEQNIGDLEKYRKTGDKIKSELVLQNVAQSSAGTREMGFNELVETREMVQRALKDLFTDNYAAGLAPHKLEGQEQGAKFINRSENPKLVAYLRLFDALTLEIMRQRELAGRKGKDLTRERQISTTQLSKLSKVPGVDLNEVKMAQFVKHLATMENLTQVLYFNLCVERLIREVSNGGKNITDANGEIDSWLGKDFTPSELSKHVKEIKNQDEKDRASQLDILRGKQNTPIEMPIRKPVHPEDLKKAA